MDISDLAWVAGTPQRLIGEARVVGVTDWVDRAITSASQLESDLQVLGFPDDEVREAAELRSDVVTVDGYIESELDTLRERDAHKKYLRTPDDVVELLSRQSSNRERLQQWLGAREVRASDVKEQEIDVPIFLLSAPRPRGCKVSFEQSALAGRALTWTVAVAGTGLGSGKTIDVTVSSQFQASAGEAKLIFLPVTVTVARVEVTARGQVLSSGVQVVAAERTADKAVGLRLLHRKAEIPFGPRLWFYPLADDAVGDVEEYTYSLERGNERSLQIGFEALGAKPSVGIKSTRSESVVLQLELSGGQDYDMHAPAEGEGVVWAPQSS